MSNEKNLALIFFALVAIIAVVGLIILGSGSGEFRLTGKTVDDSDDSVDSGNELTGNAVASVPTTKVACNAKGGKWVKITNRKTGSTRNECRLTTVSATTTTPTVPVSQPSTQPAQEKCSDQDGYGQCLGRTVHSDCSSDEAGKPYSGNCEVFPGNFPNTCRCVKKAVQPQPTANKQFCCASTSSVYSHLVSDENECKSVTKADQVCLFNQPKQGCHGGLSNDCAARFSGSETNPVIDQLIKTSKSCADKKSVTEFLKKTCAGSEKYGVEASYSSLKDADTILSNSKNPKAYHCTETTADKSKYLSQYIARCSSPKVEATSAKKQQIKDLIASLPSCSDGQAWQDYASRVCDPYGENRDDQEFRSGAPFGKDDADTILNNLNQPNAFTCVDNTGGNKPINFLKQTVSTCTPKESFALPPEPNYATQPTYQQEPVLPPEPELTPDQQFCKDTGGRWKRGYAASIPEPTTAWGVGYYISIIKSKNIDCDCGAGKIFIIGTGCAR